MHCRFQIHIFKLRLFLQKSAYKYDHSNLSLLSAEVTFMYSSAFKEAPGSFPVVGSYSLSTRWSLWTLVFHISLLKSTRKSKIRTFWLGKSEARLIVGTTLYLSCGTRSGLPVTTGSGRANTCALRASASMCPREPPTPSAAKASFHSQWWGASVVWPNLIFLLFLVLKCSEYRKNSGLTTGLSISNN